jgi:hypothetical protein
MKNRYLPRLATYVNLLEGKVRDPEFVRDFDRLVLEEWRQHRDDVSVLLETFEREMAPSFLFGTAPLSASGAAYRWVAAVADALWRTRLGTPTLLPEARRASKYAAVQFSRLAAACDAGRLPEAGASVARALDELRKFRDGCEVLGVAISALPQSIRVV